nr:hypothetical protein [Tanacetum cinerariifolium]
MILESVEHGPLLWPTIEEDGVTRLKKYSELSVAKAIQADCDVKATNIILHGLPPEVYALVSTHKMDKELWKRIQMQMQGTSLTKQERECKLYDEFDKFTYRKGEALHDFYLRFSLPLNDMNMYNMKLEQFHVNTKFLDTLPPEWSKFVTDVKLVRDLHTTNVDQLHAYLGQHKYHANEVRLILASKAILSGADNRPPMLEKDMYDSWKSRMELYMLNRQHGRMILESVEHGPLLWPTIEEDGVTRLKKYSELSVAKAIQADCDVKATNIILHGLPPEVYALVSTHKMDKELWKRIQMQMQGTSLTKQERECKLYDEFDKFTYRKGEALHDFYLRFSLPLNDMNMYNMKLEQFHVNTKFLDTLPPEWSKFVTDVKLVRDLHTTNVDQLHAYLTKFLVGRRPFSVPWIANLALCDWEGGKRCGVLYEVVGGRALA